MTDPWLHFLVVLGIALLGALLVIAVAALVSRIVGTRFDAASSLFHAARNPFRTLITVIAATIAVQTAAPGPHTGANPWWEPTMLWIRIVIIVAATWLIGACVVFLEDLALRRYRTDVSDNRVARRLRTQVLIIRRLTVVVFIVIGAGAVLLSFPGVQAVGASVLASAGVISVIAGLAAQSTLSNLFAGLQLAFSDAIRIDDVVVVQDEWGRIEEITLSYVVVHLWDDRRLVLPSTHFTTTPFANWTRRNSELLGAVEFDLDWQVDLAGMRAALDDALADTDLWDHRTHVLQVTDAVGGRVHVRVLVSAVDAGTLFDLRCHVRERLVEWVQDNGGALPRERVELVERTAHDTERPHPPTGSVPGLFSGSAEGDVRASRFTGPVEKQAGAVAATSPGSGRERAARAAAPDAAGSGDVDAGRGTAPDARSAR